jgi:hypothetical protein
MTETTDPQAVCRTTRHCADHGWCHRCAPDFAAVMSRVNVAIQRTDADEAHWGPLYSAVGDVLRAAVPSAPAGRAALRDRIAALFRCPPGAERLGDATPGEIADAVMVLLAEPVDIDPPHVRAARYAAAGNEMAASLVRDGFGDDEIAAILNGSADQVAPARHTCRNRTTVAGPDWQCPHCSTLPSRMPVEAPAPLADYERTTGHAITCLAVAGGGSDPHCPGCQTGPSRAADEAQRPEAEPCGAWGGCTLARGHNIGQADIPENHRPPAVGAQQPKEA